MASRSRLFSKIAKDIGSDGNLSAAALSSDISFGPTVYDSAGALPITGLTAGDQAYVTDNNRLYIWNGSGWYNVALLNVAPAISSVTDSNGGVSPFALSIDGVATTITITAADSDGDPITYTATADSNFAGLGTISQADNVFTITPFSQDSATTESGTITFTATDGINVASSGIQTFTLRFLSALWDETVLSVDTSSTNSLDNSTFIDRSTNAHTVTPTGSPAQTAFHPYLDNWSVEFDGTGDYLNAPTSTDFALTADFTIEAWCNFNSIAASSYIIDFRANSTDGSNNSVAIAYSSGTGKFVFNAGGVSIITGTTTIAANTWYHVAAVRNGSTITLYVNGASDGTATNSTSFTNYTNRPIIGSFATGSATFMNGFISNLRIVKGTALYTSNFTPSTENLTAVTNTILLTCQSNRFIDNSSNGYTLTVAGNPEISAFNPLGQGSEYAVGENKGAVLLDGSGDYLSAASSSDFAVGTGSWTIECWVYSTNNRATYGPGTICDLRTANIAESFAWRIQNNRALRFANAAAGTNFDTSTGVFKMGEWNHLAIVRDGSTLYQYVNGVSVGSTSTGYNWGTSGWPIRIGSNHAPGYDMDGLISDFKFVKGTAVYPGGTTFTPPTSPVGNANASIYASMDNAGIFDKTGTNTIILGGNTSTSTTETKYASTSIKFDGTGDTAYIAGGASHKFNIGGITHWTAEFWCNTTASGHQRLLTFHGPANWGLIKPVGGTTSIEWNQFGVSVGFTSGAGTLPANTWTHVALVRNGSTITCYLNGTSAGSTTSIPTSGAYEVWIGSSTGSYARSDTNGYFENVQFLSGVAKYTTNFTPPTGTQGRTYQAES